MAQITPSHTECKHGDMEFNPHFFSSSPKMQLFTTTRRREMWRIDPHLKTGRICTPKKGSPRWQSRWLNCISTAPEKSHISHTGHKKSVTPCHSKTAQQVTLPTLKKVCQISRPQLAPSKALAWLAVVPRRWSQVRWQLSRWRHRWPIRAKKWPSGRRLQPRRRSTSTMLKAAISARWFDSFASFYSNLVITVRAGWSLIGIEVWVRILRWVLNEFWSFSCWPRLCVGNRWWIDEKLKWDTQKRGHGGPKSCQWMVGIHICA